MTRHQKNPTAVLVESARERLNLFEKDVSREQWKQQHEVAMRCFSLQDTLNNGVCIYRSLVDLDVAVRRALVSATRRDHISEVLNQIQSLFVWWLKPCDRMESELTALEKEGFEVEHAAEFRQCYAEAKWILDDNALNHSKLVEARDAAIDEVRSEHGQ